MSKEAESIQNSIESSLFILEAIGDKTTVNEAKKLRQNLQKIAEMNAPIVKAYAGDLKQFDQSVIEKYGPKVGRVVEIVTLVAIAAKMFLFS